MLSLVFSMGTWFVRFEGTDRSTLEDDMNCEKETTTDGDNRRRERENIISYHKAALKCIVFKTDYHKGRKRITSGSAPSAVSSNKHEFQKDANEGQSINHLLPQLPQDHRQNCHFFCVLASLLLV